mgnify:CR=1 FL=1
MLEIIKSIAITGYFNRHNGKSRKKSYCPKFCEKQR